MRIPTLLQKIGELSAQPERCTAIDIDLMLDYTRVLYADLLEWRNTLPAIAPTPQPAQPQPVSPVAPTPRQRPQIHEPTLDELADAMAQGDDDDVETASVSGPTPAAPPLPTNQKASSSSRDIRALIGINDKYQIMSELFGNDKQGYEQALDFINQSSSERKALEWLREQLWITEERRDAAQSFFEIVERFFNK